MHRAGDPGIAHTSPDASEHHAHGPVPSVEWILQGKQDAIIPHLKTIAPTLGLDDEHFHVSELEQSERDVPALFQIELGGELVGALDFMPLPADRTLMRLYLCSDLGTQCRLANGDEVAKGFAQIWLGRLNTLGFLSAEFDGREHDRGPLGFRVPAHD